MDKSDLLMEPRLVDSIVDQLKRNRLMKVLKKEGSGPVEGPATFQIFGKTENKGNMLDLFHRLLVMTRGFVTPLHCCQTFVIVDKASNNNEEKTVPSLAHGYTIAGSVKNKEESDVLFKALDISDWNLTPIVEEALFYVLDENGNPVPSGDRNPPKSISPDGQPLGGVVLTSRGRR